jgi:hypothetical protein
MRPTAMLNPMASGSATAKGTPAFSCTSIQATETDIEATIDRSMPRPRFVSSMPMPKIPRTDTFCTRDVTLLADRKPGTATEKAAKTTTAMTRTSFPD